MDLDLMDKINDAKELTSALSDVFSNCGINSQIEASTAAILIDLLLNQMIIIDDKSNELHEKNKAADALSGISIGYQYQNSGQKDEIN